MVRRLVLAGSALALVALSACQTAPAYVAPTLPTPVPTAFKETGPWTPAAPADDAPRGAWWTVFADPVLSDLEGRIERSNPSLAAAVARYDEARALAAQARAALVPEIDIGAGLTRVRQSDNRPLRGTSPAGYNDLLLGPQISYEVDLWHRVRNTAEANGAQAQASAADLASTRLSLQAQLADSYLSMRSLDAQTRLLNATVEAYTRAQQLTQTRHSGGVVSGLDVSRASSQLESARAALKDVGASRALYEHAIATLVGEPASSFNLPVADQAPEPPHIPVQAASTLLQRRPDVAAAERRAFAANREIGVARAAMFPSLTLNAGTGFEAAGFSNLLSASSFMWTLGPQLAAPLFDGGRRKAGVAQARAAFEEASANYRQTALTAFQEVEDELALCNRLADEAQSQTAAVAAAERTENLSMIRYRQGADTYLDVVVAQTATLEAQRALLALQGRRLQAGVDLVRALGGGWQAGDLPPAKA